MKPSCAFVLLALALNVCAELEIQLPTAAGEKGPAPAFAVTPEVEDYGLLELKNGERFRVRLENYDPASGVLTARHALIRGPLPIEASALLRFTAQPARPEFSDIVGWVAQMADGDCFCGVEVTLDGDTLRLKTAYSGLMTLPRARLRWLTFGSPPSVIYQGPTAGEEWISNHRRQVLEGASLFLDKNERIGMLLPALPRKSRLDFTLIGIPHQEAHAWFYVKGADLQDEVRDDAYRLSFRGGFGNQRLVFSRIARGRDEQEIGAVPNPMGQNWQLFMNGLRVSLFFNLDERRVWLRLNGKQIAEWTDPQPMADPQRGLAFSAGSPMTISDIRVHPWDGRLETMEEYDRDDATDVVLLKSGDRLAGDVISIAQGAVRIRSQLGELTIPLEQFRQFRFRTTPITTAAATDAAQVRLLDGSSFRLREMRIENGMISGRNDHAGSISLPLKAAMRLVWLWSQETSPTRAEVPSRPHLRAAPNALPMADGAQ